MSRGPNGEHPYLLARQRRDLEHDLGTAQGMRDELVERRVQLDRELASLRGIIWAARARRILCRLDAFIEERPGVEVGAGVIILGGLLLVAVVGYAIGLA